MLILHFIFINHVCETITSAQKYKTLDFYRKPTNPVFDFKVCEVYQSFMCDPAGFHITSSTQTHDVILWSFFSQKSLLHAVTWEFKSNVKCCHCFYQLLSLCWCYKEFSSELLHMKRALRELLLSSVSIEITGTGLFSGFVLTFNKTGPGWVSLC